MYVKRVQRFSQTLPFSIFSFYFGIANPLQYTISANVLKMGNFYSSPKNHFSNP
jgi:hypothetical protein